MKWTRTQNALCFRADLRSRALTGYTQFWGLLGACTCDKHGRLVSPGHNQGF
jgi:hypothetical protein